MMVKRMSIPPWLLLATVVVLAAGAAGILLTAKHEPGPGAASDDAMGTAVTVPVEGMTCAVCVSRVRKALESIDGVQDAEVDLGHREARVLYDQSRVSPDSLVSAINQLGYKAGTPAPLVR